MSTIALNVTHANGTRVHYPSVTTGELVGVLHTIAGEGFTTSHYRNVNTIVDAMSADNAISERRGHVDNGVHIDITRATVTINGLTYSDFTEAAKVAGTLN